MTPQHIAFLAEPEPLMVTKANLRARVHRRTHMDYVGIKLFDDDGQCLGRTAHHRALHLDVARDARTRKCR